MNLCVSLTMYTTESSICSNPFLYIDIIYNLTSNGKKWKKGCEYAHHVAYDLIKKRRKELVGQFAVVQFYYKSYIYILYSYISTQILQKGVDSAKLMMKTGKRAIDFLDILLLARDDEGIGLTDEEIRVEVDTFLFEGRQ